MNINIKQTLNQQHPFLVSVFSRVSVNKFPLQYSTRRVRFFAINFLSLQIIASSLLYMCVCVCVPTFLSPIDDSSDTYMSLMPVKLNTSLLLSRPLSKRPSFPKGRQAGCNLRGRIHICIGLRPVSSRRLKRIRNAEV